MRHLLIILSCFAFNYAEESTDFSKVNNSKWGVGACLGACTEKTSVSTMEFSILRDINSQSDFHASLGSFIIFTINYGVGYRYYFNPKLKPSFFSSFSFNAATSPGAQTVTALNFTFARSLLGSRKPNINLGIVLSYSNFFKKKHELILLPLINLEINY